MSELYRNIHYCQDLSFLKSCNIYEYDIQKANISILFNKGKISEDDYNFFRNIDNMTRKVMIGYKMKKDKSLVKTVQEGIVEAKEELFNRYNLNEKNILLINNDAVYTLKELPHTIEINYPIRFTLRNRYTLFLRVQRLKIFYLWDSVKNEEKLDISGIRDEVLEHHKNYMCDFLMELFKTFQTSDIVEVINLLRVFYDNYVNKKLDIGYYRDMFTGQYPLTTDSMVFNYKATIPGPTLLPIIEISNNSAFLRELSRIFYTEYLRDK